MCSYFASHPCRRLHGLWRRLLLPLLLLLSIARAPAVGEAVVEFIGGGEINDSGSVNFGNVTVGTSSVRNYQFKNISPTLIMTGIAFSKNGAHASDFALSAPATNVLLPGGVINFSITFTPSASFTRTAAIHIANSDPNENPYDLNLSGTGIAPDIAVSVGGVTMTDGASTVNFGKVRVGLSGTRMVSIRNTGNTTLSNLSLSLSGGSYSITPLQVTSLAQNLSTTVTLSFTPQDTFTSTGTLRISSNDSNESPFDIALTGAGVLPYLDVESPPGTPIYDGADLLTLSAPVGIPVQRTFLMRNVSGGTISGLAVNLDGTGAADFSNAALPGTTLDPNATMSFTVTFLPQALGDVSAALHIASDQAFGDPFDIALTGTGLSLPDDGDADSDGVLNMLEIATGHDPLTPGPQPGVLVKNGNNLELTFHRRVASFADTTLTVEWSDDPAGLWTTLDNSAAFIVGGDDILQEIRYLAPAGTGHRFLRIRATKF